MSDEIKVYRIYGKMLISHDKLPTWVPFRLELRALKAEHAIEKAYSELGSRHKLRRKHIRIERIEELPRTQALSKKNKELDSLERCIIP